MKESKAEESILHTVRRSIRGEVVNVIIRLEVGASIHDIVHKMDSIGGYLLEQEDVLAEFYSARQKVNESCLA